MSSKNDYQIKIRKQKPCRAENISIPWFESGIGHGHVDVIIEETMNIYM